MAEKGKLSFKNFVVPFLLVTTLLFNLAALYRGRFMRSETGNTENCTVTKKLSQTNKYELINVAFFGKYAYRNMKIVRGMARTFNSILEHTSTPIYLHVLIDLNSKLRVSRTLKKVARNFRKRLNITYYDVDEMVHQNQEMVSLIKKYFFSKDVGRYNDGIFFLSEVFHTALPKRLHKIIFLDVDLKFLTDILELYREFDKFQPENVMGIAPDLQPQYRVDFGHYRKLHPGTSVGSERPGRQGFNTGVVLFHLDHMRQSQLYNSLLNATVLEMLCTKYDFKGYLGHQDFFTLTGMEYPELYHDLDCVWNRQLDVGWRNVVGAKIFNLYHKCPGEVKILHANGDAVLKDKFGDKIKL